MVASEQSLPGHTVEEAEPVVAHIISTSYYAKNRQTLESAKDETLTTTAKDPACSEMMHDMARCNLSQIKRNRDSDN